MILILGKAGWKVKGKLFYTSKPISKLKCLCVGACTHMCTCTFFCQDEFFLKSKQKSINLKEYKE